VKHLFNIARRRTNTRGSFTRAAVRAAKKTGAEESFKKSLRVKWWCSSLHHYMRCNDQTSRCDAPRGVRLSGARNES
jgi:hypothetical protein